MQAGGHNSITGFHFNKDQSEKLSKQSKRHLVGLFIKHDTDFNVALGQE